MLMVVGCDGRTDVAVASGADGRGDARAVPAVRDAEPVEASRDSASRPVALTTTLATGQNFPFAVAVDAHNVYWLDQGFSEGRGKSCCTYTGGQVMECPLAGCNGRPTVLATVGFGPGGYFSPFAGSLVLDPTNVYWADGSGVRACAIDGCDDVPTVIAGGVEEPVGLAVRGGRAYWIVPDVAAIPDPGLVSSAPITGAPGPANVLASTTTGATAIVADDSFAYWTNERGVIERCPLSSTDAGATTVWTAPTDVVLTNLETNTYSLAVDTLNLYWANGDPDSSGSVLQCSKADCGGTLVTLATGRDGPASIAVDEARVYWGETTGVYACSIGGCGNSPTQVASSPAFSVAVDETHVYWTVRGTENGEGQVMMAPKP